MSDFYDEFPMMSISEADVNRILKFHQSSITVKDQAMLDVGDVRKANIAWLEKTGNSSLRVEVFQRKHQLSELYGSFGMLYKLLRKTFNTFKTITTLPIMTVYRDQSDGIDAGFYSFDFDNRLLLKYADICCDKLLRIAHVNDVQVSLSLFLNIERSILAYHSEAYISGIIQVGELTHAINEECLARNIPIIDTYFNTQLFTHAVGISVRKQLLIKNIFMGYEL
ncbi:MAG: hypothetical protein FWC13_09675 [Oscillospiraceae bacterium]|nr:hypothetical protein [Oscillospiraceae bacterium]